MAKSTDTFEELMKPRKKLGHQQRYNISKEEGRDVGYVTAGPFGPTVYLIMDDKGTILDWRGTRHEAVGRVSQLQEPNPHHIVPVPIGMVPISDVRSIRREITWSE